MGSSTDLAERERAAAEARAMVAKAEAAYRAAELTLERASERLAEAKATAAKASGKFHLAHIRAMLGGVD